MPVQGKMYATPEDVAAEIISVYGGDIGALERVIAEVLHLTLQKEGLGWFWRDEYEQAGKDLKALGVD